MRIKKGGTGQEFKQETAPGQFITKSEHLWDDPINKLTGCSDQAQRCQSKKVVWGRTGVRKKTWDVTQAMGTELSQ